MAITRDDVARLAGVSNATVSNVVNNVPTVSEEIRRRVLRSVQELSYVPNEAARSLKLRRTPGKTFNIGCVLFVDDSAKFSDPYHSKILEGIDREVVRQGYHMFFTYTGFQLDSNLNLFGRMINTRNVDGIITFGYPTLPMEQELIKKIRSRIESVVCLGAPFMDNVDNIEVDMLQSGYEAAKYLIGLGHKSIGYIGYNFSPLDKRFKGYRMALEDAGLEFNDSVIEIADSDTVDKGYEHMKKILEKANPLPTAIFGYSDQTALGAVMAIREKGLKIPDDISVIGIDDIADARNASPPLTTLRVEKEKLGSLGVTRLIERIKKPDIQPVRIVVPIKLVVRKSCRDIKHD